MFLLLLFLIIVITMVAYVVKSGGRPSPPEHAADYKYKQREGTDGNVYVSRPDKNGIFKWFKYKEPQDCKNAIEFHKQERELNIRYKCDMKKFKELKKLLIKHDIVLFHSPWKKSYYQYEYMFDHFKEACGGTNEKLAILYSDYDILRAQLGGTLYCDHSLHFAEDCRNAFNDIKAIFPDVTWNMTRGQAIRIPFVPIK